MIIDLIFVAIGIAWVGISILTHDPGAFLTWCSVVVYAFMNFSERRLKGSKYDY